MEQFGTGQALDVPGLIVQQIRRAHRDQQLWKQITGFPVWWKMPIAQQYGTVERLVIEVHRVDIHPGAGQLHLIARLQMPEATQARQ
ncbi:hypothetical protein D3C71_1763590 [compost metagenome]